MRIALVTHDIPPVSTSGVGSYTLHCAAAIARYSGHEPHVFACGISDETRRLLPAAVHLHHVPELAEGVAAGQIDARAGGVLGNAGLAGQLYAHSELICQSVRDVHRATPFDVVETPDVYAAGLPLMLRPIPGVPVVTMLHAGTAISRYFNEMPVSADDRLTIALEFAAMALADGLCAPTRAVVRATGQFMNLPQDVEVFPSPLPAGGSAADLPNHASAGDYVMFAGRIERLKGCCELALAANIFLKACPDAALHLYGPDRPLAAAPAIGGHCKGQSGDGWAGGSTKQWMIARLDRHVLPRVRFMGTVSPQEMARAYAGARFVVAPSRFENFGTTAVEALVARRPVVYAAGTGLEEIVAEAGMGVRAEDSGELAAHMIRLWNDAALRRELVDRGANRLGQALAPRTAVARRIEFYARIIARGPIDQQNRIERLAVLAPGQLLAVLGHISGMVGQLAGARHAVKTSPGTRAARALEQLRRNGTLISAIWLYGGGQHTRRLLVERETVQQAGGRICGIIDDAAGPGATLLGLPVMSRTAAEDQHAAGKLAIDVLVLSSDSMEETLWTNAQEFRGRNVPVARLYA